MLIVRNYHQEICWKLFHSVKWPTMGWTAGNRFRDRDRLLHGVLGAIPASHPVDSKCIFPTVKWPLITVGYSNVGCVCPGSLCLDISIAQRQSSRDPMCYLCLYVTSRHSSFMQRCSRNWLCGLPVRNTEIMGRGDLLS
jgi:hypothetical protein